MKSIRVLVVEDSLTVRKRLCEILDGDPAFELVGEAEDGKQAIEMCQALRPDVMTLDMMMPVLSGLAATEYIMAYCPTPILVVSASTNRGELFKTYEALAAGAVEVMEKPGPEEADGVWEQRFLGMVKLVARVKVITHLRGRSTPLNGRRVKMETLDDPRAPQMCRLVALGASTGGPSALVEVLRALPANYSLPVLVVIHIGEPFGASFADWLDGQTAHTVRMAQDSQHLPQRGVILAPPNHHLLLRQGRLYLDSGLERHSCRPSVDVLFESLAAECGQTVAACVLTGMGADGARGLLAIRQAGGLTLAQDEASSIVYGMPREAALLGAAKYVLPLPDIGPMLASLTRVA
ncbi:MAG: chemotaxis-specific protein-glutamate methyltransferase CheB [Pseudomonadota bacterium]